MPGPGLERLAESESIQNQKSMLTQYAAEMGWEVFRIYADEDYSGADRDRPEFGQLIADAAAGRFEVVLCKTQSRFTRDMELLEKYIHGLFPLWGIRFIALVDHADTEVKGNKKSRQINGLVNEWYLEDLSENIRAVLDSKRKSGKFIGSFPVYGYRKDPSDHNHLVVDDEAAEVVRLIFRLASNGYGKQKIAEHLNEKGVPNPTKYKAMKGYAYVNAMAENTEGLWNRTTVGRILRNETYVGTLVQGKRRKASYKTKKVLEVPKEAWIRIAGTHEGIIREDDFLAVADLRNTRRRADGMGESHMLAGKVFCMHCGSAMRKSTAEYKGTRHAYLRCSRCKKHSIRLDLLESTVNQKLSGYLDSYCADFMRSDQTADSNAAKQKKKLQTQANECMKKMNEYSAAIENLYLDKSAGRIDQCAYLELSKGFTEKKRVLSGKLAGLSQQLREWTEVPDKDTLVRNAVSLLLGAVKVSQKDPLSGDQQISIQWLF